MEKMKGDESLENWFKKEGRGQERQLKESKRWMNLNKCELF